MPENPEFIPVLIVSVGDDPMRIVASGVTGHFVVVVDGDRPIGMVEWGALIRDATDGVEQFRHVAMRVPTHRLLELESAGDSDNETVDDYDFGNLSLRYERSAMRIVENATGGPGVFDPQLPGTPQVPLLYRVCTQYQHPNFIAVEYPGMDCSDPTPVVHPLR